MNRSFSTFRETQPSTDGMKKATYSATVPPNHAQHPVIMDAEGRQIPIIRHAGSGSNGETFVIKTEKIMEHSFVPAPISSFLVTGYRYSSEQPGKEEKFQDSDPYTLPGSTYRCPEKADSSFDRPEKVDEFITKIVTESGRRPTRSVVIPLSSGWYSRPNRVVQGNTRKYGDEREFRGDNRNKLNDSPKRDRHNEPFLNNKGANTHPTMGNSRDVYERPRGNEGPNARSHPLSKPTIGTAVESFKELSVKPSYGNENRPTKTLHLGSTRPHTGSNISAPKSKMEFKDYESDESEEDEEEGPNPRHGKRDEFEIVNNQEGRQPFEKKDGYETPKGNAAAVPLPQTRFPSSTMQKKEQYAYPEKIDSREASRRYGKSSAQPVGEEKPEGTISSTDAMIKYNGALIP